MAKVGIKGITKRTAETTPSPRKNYNTVYVAITLANKAGF